MEMIEATCEECGADVLKVEAALTQEGVRPLVLDGKPRKAYDVEHDAYGYPDDVTLVMVRDVHECTPQASDTDTAPAAAGSTSPDAALVGLLSAARDTIANLAQVILDPDGDPVVKQGMKKPYKETAEFKGGTACLETICAKLELMEEQNAG